LILSRLVPLIDGSDEVCGAPDTRGDVFEAEICAGEKAYGSTDQNSIHWQFMAWHADSLREQDADSHSNTTECYVGTHLTIVLF
jgi:hypothetical protein